MRRPASAAYLLVLLLVTAGCAMSPDGAGRPLTGTAGPVEWEVIDGGRIVQQLEFEW
jgi:hypothetical protein